MQGSFFMKPVAATERLWSYQSFPSGILWAKVKFQKSCNKKQTA